VRGAVLGGASGRLAAAVVLTAAAASVHDAVLGATMCGRLTAAVVVASLAASVRDAVGGGAGCELYAPLVLAAAGHVHTAPAKPAPPPRRRERRALPVCLVYDVSHAVPRNASRTRGVDKEISNAPLLYPSRRALTNHPSVAGYGLSVEECVPVCPHVGVEKPPVRPVDDRWTTGVRRQVDAPGRTEGVP
jgi:hypothetical protein